MKIVLASSPTIEIAHVLFMDVVSYSTQPMGTQKEILDDLRRMVTGTSEFIRAQREQELISLPTGDGMALVFFTSPEAPLLCALEISRATRTKAYSLRMGIHTGPVYRVEDINANRNVAGGGINLRNG